MYYFYKLNYDLNSKFHELKPKIFNIPLPNLKLRILLTLLIGFLKKKKNCLNPVLFLKVSLIIN